MNKDNEMHLYKANAQGMRCQIKPKLVLPVFSLVMCRVLVFLDHFLAVFSRAPFYL